MGLPAGNSALVTVPGDLEALRAAGIQAAAPGGKVRVGFHLYNDEEDVEVALDALSG